MQSYDVTIVGGCGRVGLPLGLAFAQRGLQVALYDLRADAEESVNAGRMPFVEPGTPAGQRFEQPPVYLKLDMAVRRFGGSPLGGRRENSGTTTFAAGAPSARQKRKRRRP